MIRINPLPCLIAFLLITACQTSDKPDLTIATAANMQFVMEELSKAFTEESGITCGLTISSSGKLTAQIKEGAPYDIFVAANMKYPNELHQYGLTLGEPKVYTEGRLVLWSMKEGLLPALDILEESTVHHIALANPKIAPYGIAAVEVLKSKGLYERLESKLVFGESIAQVNQFISTQSAEAGFTAMSVVLSPQMKGKGRWVEIDSSFYTPIEQGIALLNKDVNAAKAEKFYAFMFSEKAKKILGDFGYRVIE